MGIFYKNNNIHNKFIGSDEDRVKVWDYKMPKKPLLSKQCGSGVFYSQEWGMIVVDEAQKYTNILKNVEQYVVYILKIDGFYQEQCLMNL